MSTLHLELAPVELALARAAIYRFSSELFRHPDARWKSECSAWSDGVQTALSLCATEDCDRELVARLGELTAHPIQLENIVHEHAHVFGHVARGRVTPYETEWSGAAGSFLQFHLLSDLSAFYEAFGVKLALHCDERADHLSIELAFLHLLCAKEAWALENDQAELVTIVRDAEATFLREHLGRWAPAFCVRLEHAGSPYYARVARWLGAWVAAECRRVGVPTGDPSLELGETTFTPEDACMSCEKNVDCLVRSAVPSGQHGPDPD